MKKNIRCLLIGCCFLFGPMSARRIIAPEVMKGYSSEYIAKKLQATVNPELAAEYTQELRRRADLPGFGGPEERNIESRIPGSRDRKPKHPPLTAQAQGDWYWLEGLRGAGEWVWTEKGKESVEIKKGEVLTPVEGAVVSRREPAPAVSSPIAPDQLGGAATVPAPVTVVSSGAPAGVSVAAVPSVATIPAAPAAPAAEAVPSVAVKPKLPLPSRPGLGGIKLPEKKEEQKPQEPADRVLASLSEQELAALTSQEKERSDELMAAALVAAASRAFIAAANEKVNVQIGEGSEAISRTFPSAYDAALFFIKESLVRGAGQLPEFKKREELKEVLKTGGTFDAFIKKYLLRESKVPLEQFLRLMYERIEGELKQNALLQELLVLFQSCFFADQKIAHVAPDTMVSLVANIVVAQRPLRSSAGPAQQIASDRSVEELFKKFFIYLQMPTALDGAHDPIEELRGMINRLRVHPQFQRFDKVGVALPRGYYGASGAKKSGAGLLAIQKIPVLELLASDQQDASRPQVVVPAIKTQMLYDVGALDDILLPTTPAFQQALAVHQTMLAKEKGAFDVYAYLQAEISRAKKVKDVVTILDKLETKIGKGNASIVALKKELNTFSPDVPAVMQNIQVLSGHTTLEFEQHLQELITAHAAEKLDAIAAGEILKEAHKKAAAKEDGIGFYVVTQLLDQGRIKSLSARNRVQLTSIERTPESVMAAFIQVMGSPQEVEKYAKAKDFYAWVEPYGLLIMTLKEALEEKGESGVAPIKKLGRLLASLSALDSGKITLASEKYLPVINRERKLVTAGIYTGKLTRMIGDLEQYDVVSALSQLDSLVAKAQVGVEKSDEYKNFVTQLASFLIKTMLEQINYEVRKLSEGGGFFEIAGLSLVGTNRKENARNASVYSAISSLFTPLVKGIGIMPARLNPEAVFSEIQKAKEAVPTLLQAAPIEYMSDSDHDAQRAYIQEKILEYLSSIEKRIANLQAAHQQYGLSAS